MKAMIRAACVALAVLAYAVPASAVDFTGYFRDSFGQNSKGGGQACYKVTGGDYKLRLGNECDNYGEWGLTQSIYKDKSGVEFTVGVMFNYDQSNGTNNGSATPFGIQQNFVKAKFPMLAGATFWAGKQYYERENIDMIDFFYLNTSDTGIGVEEVDTGFGKPSFSVFGVNGTPGGQGSTLEFTRPDVRLQGIPVWTDGTLEFDANAVLISRNKDLNPKGDNEASTSVWLTAEWHQANILGGWNTLVAQFANGAASNMGGGKPGFGILGFGDPLDKNNQQFRVLDQLLLQPTNQFQILVGGMYQMKQFGDLTNKNGGKNTKVTQYGIFTRPVYYINDYFKLQGDIGYTATDASNFVDKAKYNLLKATFAPTLTPAVGDGGGFFVRPELRLFVTYGSWNDNSVNNVPGPTATPADGTFGTAKNGTTFGMSVETWF
jgi:maltoporin